MFSIFKNHKHFEIYEIGEPWPYFQSAVTALRVIDGLMICVSGRYK